MEVTLVMSAAKFEADNTRQVMSYSSYLAGLRKISKLCTI